MQAKFLYSFAGLIVAAAAGWAQPCVTIECPTNIVVECASPAGEVVTFAVPATNHCSTNLSVQCNPSSGSVFAPGSTTVTCVASDGQGETNECSFLVTVQDTTAPELQCPRLILTPCESPAGATVTFTVTATDASDTNPMVVCSPASGTTFAPGTNSVQCQAWDASGNTNTCSFEVVVTGSCAPDPCLSILCPPDLVTNCTGLGGTPVAFAVQATNHCGGLATVTCDPPSGSVFPPGINTVLCRADDGRGTEVYCSFTIEVMDEVAPTINCPTNLLVEAECLDGAVVSWSVSASDNCDTNVAVYCDPPPGRVFPPGTTQVICRAQDGSGNTAFCGFAITVTNSQPFRIERGGASDVVLRWRGNGVPEEASSLDPPVAWQPVTLPIQTNGSELSVQLPLTPSLRFFRLVSQPLLPPPDSDGDGVADAQDLCPDTPAGLAVQACGCSLTEIARSPQRISREAVRQLQQASNELNFVPDFVAVAGAINQHLADMQEAERLIRAGQISPGVSLFEQAVDGVEAEQRSLQADIQQLKNAQSGQPVPGTQGYGDTTEWEARFEAYDVMESMLGDGLARARVAETNLQALQLAVTGTNTLSGVITQINDAERWMRLDTGQMLGFAEKWHPTPIVEGNQVSLSTLTFNNGNGVVLDIIGVAPSPPFPPLVPVIQSVYLQVVPLQRFPPFSDGPFVRHWPGAYEHEGRLWLEEGMRLGVKGVGPLFNPNTNGTFYIYRMMLDLTLKGKGQAGASTITLANSLGPSDPPVPLPVNLDPDYPHTLTASILRFECGFIGPIPVCSEPDVLSVKAYKLRFNPRGSYAVTGYDAMQFDLEDRPFNLDFRPARADSVQTFEVFGASQLQFQAEGHRIINGQSPWPDVKTVLFNQDFAVHTFDFVNPDDPDAEARWGTANRAALMWPMLTGTRNGRTFAYTCRLPAALVRDVVAFCTPPPLACGTAPNTFYRLPFTGGWPTWRMGQGNCGNFTHANNSKFAFDMPAPQGTPIRAARGGVVVNLGESTSGNCYDSVAGECINCGPTPANFVKIQHQDGTYGRYFHMPQNGVSVVKGQEIYRGDVLGVVGNTGCSSTPHLHFEVRATLTGPTIPASFEAFTACTNLGVIFPCQPLRECYVPQSGDILFSSNKGWWE